MQGHIEGGYIIIARKIETSSIAEAPPYAREIWFYLLRTANHKDNNICKRGQTIRRYIDIREALKWYIGYRKCMYSITQCENAMKLLMKARMITKMRTTRGLLITICNYNTYQNPKLYESQNEKGTSATMEPQHRHTINKNVKKDKNDKKKEKKNISPKTLYLDRVFLTDDEHRKLYERFGEDVTRQLIESLNDGIGSKGYKYNSHYSTILVWARKDGIQKKETPQEELARLGIQ